MLESTDLSDCEENINYILHNQNPIIGGIGKQDNEFPDPLHTFMGIAGLSLAHYENLNPVNAALTMSQNAFEHMKSIQPKFQQRWFKFKLTWSVMCIKIQSYLNHAKNYTFLSILFIQLT